MGKKIIVLFLGKNPPPYYGVSIWFEQLQAAQWPADYEILWFHNGIHKSITTIGTTGILSFYRHICLHFKYLLFLLKHKPGIIVIPISQSFVGYVKDSVYILLSCLFKGKTLVMLHGSNLKTWLSTSHHLIRAYFRITLKSCSGAIVLSEKLKYIFEDYFPTEKIFAVPNGLNFDLPLQKESKNKTPVLCYLGNLYISKGVEDIIQSLILLSRAGIDYKMIFIGGWGDNETRVVCEKLVKENNLNVEFVGVKTGKEKYAVLNLSDIFIFTPNKPEGLPYVILEAMALGLPIISTNQGAITDAVIHNRNGYIVESGKVDSIYQGIRDLIKEPHLRNTMGSNSRILYEKYFTAEKMIEDFVKTFQSIIR